MRVSALLQVGFRVQVEDRGFGRLLAVLGLAADPQALCRLGIRF
jgi:hypothetical protein